MKALLSLFALVAFATCSFAQTTAERLEGACVTIKAGRAQGSGALFTTSDNRTWVLTAGHVIEGLREERKITDEKGGTRTTITFPDVQIFQISKEDGRNVGSTVFDCQVIRYSGPDYGEDIALLRVRSKKYRAPFNIASFATAAPAVGTHLVHCGSLLGEAGNGSITWGVMSSLGRIYEDKLYDQVSCTALPGSSGGPVVRESDGAYVGMLVRGVRGSDGFNFVVPARRINAWATRVGVSFLISGGKCPTDLELVKKPIEEPESTAHVQRSYGEGENKCQTFLIHLSPPGKGG